MVMSKILELALTSEGHRAYLVRAYSITTATPTIEAGAVSEGDSVGTRPLLPPMTPLEHIDQGVLQAVLVEHPTDWSRTLFTPYGAVEEAAELENSKVSSAVTSDKAASRANAPSRTRSSTNGSFDSGEGEAGSGNKQTILR